MADDDGEGGDRAVGEQDDAGAGARGGSALHMNPLRQALPGGGGGGGGEPRPPWSAHVATAAHADHAGVALRAALVGASAEGRAVVLALKKNGLVDPKHRRPGRPSGPFVADCGSIILCCGPGGAWPSALTRQMRGGLDGVSLHKARALIIKEPGRGTSWADGFALKKVVLALNGLLAPMPEPEDAHAAGAPDQTIGTSFVLCSARILPGGLCEHELVVHQCAASGADIDALRVLRRMRDQGGWLSDLLLLDTRPDPPREDLLFIISDDGGITRYTEWLKTGMKQLTPATRAEVLTRPSPVRGSTPPF